MKNKLRHNNSTFEA